MKLIHTSDWHLGQNFFGFDRREDHANMVEQLIGLVMEEQPDALIIAGDIYDVAAPNTSVQKDFSEYIVKLHLACPGMKIVCISGNHDSASRHEIYQAPWEALNVKMIGKIDKENFDANIIEVPGKGWIVAVPYINERFLDENFYSLLEAKTKEVTGEDLPVVYVGHSAISGTDFTGHQKQNDRFIGGIECTGLEQLGSHYDYVALGHIHKAQTFGEGRARYCGTPLPVSFDEVRSGYEHGFDIVEINMHGEVPDIRTVGVKCKHALVNIPSEGHAPWADVIKDVRSFPADKPAYLRLNVLMKENEVLPYNRDNLIEEALKGKLAQCATINPVREEVAFERDENDALGPLTVQELQNIDHKKILTEYANGEGFVFTDEFERMFNKVYNIVTDADYENQ